MKFKHIVFAVFIIIYHAQGVKGQSGKDIKEIKISISASKKPLKSVIQEIENKTNFIFSYNSAKINIDSLVSINAINTKVIDILNKLFARNISFQISSNNVILFPSERKTSRSDSKAKIKQSHLASDTIRDTVWLKKTDTLFLVRTDTLVRTIRDTIIINQVKEKTVKRDEKKSSCLSTGLIYQLMKLKSNYAHFGLNQEDLDIKALIHSSENMKMAYRLGFMSSLVRNNLVLSSGLFFFKVNEEYNYLVYSDSLSLIQIPLSDTLFHVTGENKYRYISLPLSIGYVFKISPKFNMDANLGAWFNYLISTNGICVKLNSKAPYILNKIDQSQMNKFTIDFELSILFEYLFSKQMSLKIGPSLSLQINSDYIKDYPVTKQKNAFGINFSIYRYF